MKPATTDYRAYPDRSAAGDAPLSEITQGIEQMPDWALQLAGEIRVWCREMGAEECEARIAEVLVSMADNANALNGVFGE